MRAKTPIPGNRYSELTRIDADATRDYLVAELRKIKQAQQANMRGNARYVRTVKRYEAAIAARSVQA